MGKMVFYKLSLLCLLGSHCISAQAGIISPDAPIAINQEPCTSSIGATQPTALNANEKSASDKEPQKPISLEKKEENQNWAIHVQGTEVLQGQPGGFSSPYHGNQSLVPSDNFRQTTSLDLFLDARLWPGGELYFNPGYYQGFGLGLSHGIAQFTNAEAYKVGKYRGDLYIPHLFFRQIIGFGGEKEHLDADQLQLAEDVDISRLTMTAGKMSVGDQFDNNSYSHDPRTQFLNWTLVDGGWLDYAADALGYEYGITLDFNQKWWAARWGIFTVPRVANGLATEGRLDRAWQQVAELERRWEINGHPGKIRLTGFLESANMGSYRSAVENFPASQPNLTATRRYRLTYGIGVNAEQELTSDIGVFLRAGYRDPNYEEYQFTDVSKSFSIGALIKGTKWNRPNDTFGLADTLAGIGHQQQVYLNDGGMGVVIGDGKLPHYGLENVIETFYNFEVIKGINLTCDYQLVANPGYNEDRGPIHVFSARVHFEY
jgi:high affinity Mn2+ porin